MASINHDLRNAENNHLTKECNKAPQSIAREYRKYRGQALNKTAFSQTYLVGHGFHTPSKNVLDSSNNTGSKASPAILFVDSHPVHKPKKVIKYIELTEGRLETGCSQTG